MLLYDMSRLIFRWKAGLLMNVTTQAGMFHGGVRRVGAGTGFTGSGARADSPGDRTGHRWHAGCPRRSGSAGPPVLPPVGSTDTTQWAPSASAPRVLGRGWGSLLGGPATGRQMPTSRASRSRPALTRPRTQLSGGPAIHAKRPRGWPDFSRPRGSPGRSRLRPLRN